MQLSDRRLAGFMGLTGGVECLLGISIAEELYPGYSVSTNYISDLGATCRSSSCTIVEPSSIVFNISVALLGGLLIMMSYFLYRAAKQKTLYILMVLAGIGALGVGFFPETTGIVHRLFSLVVFLFGGLAAVWSSRIMETPVNYVAVVLGLVTLLALVLFTSGNYAGLGPGGMERMVADPALLWLVGFGAYLTKT